MTSLAAAIASDSRGPCSLYIITDSRITWDVASERWDAGRKTFCSPASADIFGYCGDAFFLPVALGQVLSLIALQVVEIQTLQSAKRHELFLELLKAAIEKVETKYISKLTLFHGARDGELMEARFRLWRSEYNPKSKAWIDEELALAYGASYFASLDGTGAAHVERFVERMETVPAAGTSRAAMHGFCQALHANADPFSGGAPQLVGLWRKGPARHFGFCWHGKSYIAGMEIPQNASHASLDWFNHLFERCDGKSGRKLKQAKAHRSSLRPNSR